MELLIAFITLLLGLAVGAFIVWFSKEGQAQQAVAAAQAENLAAIAAFEEKCAALSQREGQLNSELAVTRQEVDHRRIRAEDEMNLLRQELSRLREENIHVQGQLATERQIAAEKQRLLGELEQRFAQALGAASQQVIEAASQRAAASFSEKVIENSSKGFLDMTKTALEEFRPLVETLKASKGASNGHGSHGFASPDGSADASTEDTRQLKLAEMVKPLDDTLRKVEDQLREMEKERSGEFQTILERVKELGESQSALRAEAGRLANALRTPVQRGLWGEVQLRRVVEMAGMLEHCEFRMAAPAAASMDETAEIPSLATSPDGSPNGHSPSDAGRNPSLADLTVHLPGSRSISVNAQAPVNAYLDALAADSEPTQDREMARHAAELREHVDRLSVTLQMDLSGSQTDFVVAFLPGEAFLSAALAQDPALLEYSLGKRVLLTTPTTLVSLLKTASYGWNQEDVAENARQIRELGRELYDRLRVLTGHFNGIKRGLETTLRAYNDAAGSMETRVLASARRFKELGVANGHSVDAPQAVGFGPREIHMPELRALVGSPSGNGDGD